MFRRKIALAMALAIAASMMLAGTALASGKDRNQDRIPDRWEKAHHLSLKVKQGARDQDHDGLKNRGEWRARLDPRDDDTDNDGVEDGDESAGTVASFEGDVLTIALAGGGTLSARVTDETEVECDDDAGDDRGHHKGEDRGHHKGEDRGHHKGEDRGHASRDGDDEPGDDEGKHGDDEPGDDHGDDDGENDEHGGDGENEHCGTDALVAGAKVLEAELKLTDGGAIWTDVELLKA